MQDAEAELELTARRVRRVVRAFRLVFYPGAVIVALLLITGRGDDDLPVFLDGTTSQGGHVELRLDGDGEPTTFGTRIALRCPAGDWWTSWYHRLEGGRLHLRNVSRRRYEYYDQTGVRTVTLAARLDDGALHGTVAVVEDFDGPYWGAYRCESGPVTLTARQR